MNHFVSSYIVTGNCELFMNITYFFTIFVLIFSIFFEKQIFSCKLGLFLQITKRKQETKDLFPAF